jgi:hypothetical protein
MPWLNGQATIPEKWELGSRFSLQCIREDRRCWGCIGNTLLPAPRWRGHCSTPAAPRAHHTSRTITTSPASSLLVEGVGVAATAAVPPMRLTESSWIRGGAIGHCSARGLATGVNWRPSGSSNEGARSSRRWPKPPVTFRVS